MPRMFIILLALLTTISVTTAAAVPRHNDRAGRLNIPLENLFNRRQNTSAIPVFVNQTIDLSTHTFQQRDQLLNTSNGMTLTCVDCAMSGSFTFNAEFSLNPEILDEFVSAASAALATVTQGFASLETAAGSGLASITSALGQALPTAEATITSEGATVVSHITSGVVSDFTVVTSALAPVISGLAGILPREVVRRDLSSILADAVGNFRIEVAQIAPISTTFNLEFASGADAIEFDYPPDSKDSGSLSFGSGALISPSAPATTTFGPFRVGFQVSPLGMEANVALAPHINVTIPMAASLSIAEPLVLDEGGFQNPNISFIPTIGDPVLNAIDPQLCLNALLGPQIVLSLEHPETNIFISFVGTLELPKASLCFSNATNVDSSCSSSASNSSAFSTALQIQASLEYGAVISSTFQVDGHKVPVPVLDDLPSLVTDFGPIETCFDLSGLESLAGADGLTTVPVFGSVSPPANNLTVATNSASISAITVSSTSSISVQALPTTTHYAETSSTTSSDFSVPTAIVSLPQPSDGTTIVFSEAITVLGAATAVASISVAAAQSDVIVIIAKQVAAELTSIAINNWPDQVKRTATMQETAATMYVDIPGTTTLTEVTETTQVPYTQSTTPAAVVTDTYTEILTTQTALLAREPTRAAKSRGSLVTRDISADILGILASDTGHVSGAAETALVDALLDWEWDYEALEQRNNARNLDEDGRQQRNKRWFWG